MFGTKLTFSKKENLRSMLKRRFGAIARESHMKQGLRTSFLGTRPRAFPPPGDRFAAQTTENQNYNWACPVGSPVINLAWCPDQDSWDIEYPVKRCWLNNNN